MPFLLLVLGGFFIANAAAIRPTYYVSTYVNLDFGTFWTTWSLKTIQ